MDYNEVVALIDDYEKEVRGMKKLLFKFVWSMRGGISLEEMYNSSLHDRKIISEVIDENLKITKESGLPYF